MTRQHLIEQLHTLRLTGFVQALEIQLSQPNTYGELDFMERLALLVDNESTYRDNRKTGRLLRNARLRMRASLADMDYQHPRGLSKSVIADLSRNHWITHHHNVFIEGPTGCGKTYIACALAQHCCEQGISVQYYRSSRLFEALTIAHGDGSFPKLLQQLAKTNLLVIDDWGLEKLTASQRSDMLEIIEDRDGNGSTLITSQLPVTHWHDAIGEPTVADAILDRLLANAHKMKLKGDSMRKRKRSDSPTANGNKTGK